jgi:hypothetical protein
VKTSAKPPVYGRETAEILGAQALNWLAGDIDRLGAFLAASGLSPQELMARAADPRILGAVLDHLMTEDALVMAFCDEMGLNYLAPQAARQALPGGETYHWT